MRVILYRHAQSESNTQPHLIGGAQPYTPLTLHGIRQAEALGVRLRGELQSGHIVLPDSVTSSTAVRTQATADTVFRVLDISVPIISDTRLTELSQGDWEGQPRAEIYTPEMCDLINSTDGAHRPPNGESQIDVADRMEDWLNSLPEGNHWAFSHSLSISCLIQRLVGGSPGKAFLHAMENTGITEIEKKPLGWGIRRFADGSHVFTIK